MSEPVSATGDPAGSERKSFRLARSTRFNELEEQDPHVRQSLQRPHRQSATLIGNELWRTRWSSDLVQTNTVRHFISSCPGSPTYVLTQPPIDRNEGLSHSTMMVCLRQPFSVTSLHRSGNIIIFQDLKHEANPSSVSQANASR